jgi:methyl-accepting chemotaxis protein
MNNLKIGGKLFLGFGVVLFLLVLSNGLGLRSLATSDKHFEEIAASQKLSENASNVRNNITRIIDATKSLILLENIDQKKQVLADIGRFRDIYKENLASLLKNSTTAEGKQLAEHLQESILAGKATSIKLIDLAMHDDRQGFITLWQQEANPINERNLSLCKEVKEHFAKLSAVNNAAAVSGNRQAKVMLIAFSIIAMIFSVFVAGYSTRKIAGPINRCVLVADRIAAGDLTAEINAEGRDETALLMKAMQHMTNSLKKTMTTLSTASQGISGAATKLRATSGMMAEGAEEVVSQASSVATAGEEMAATAGEIAQNCHLTALSASRADAVAKDGFKVVENSVAVMRAIADRVKSAAKSVDSLGSRSEQIGEIIGTIEDIADQTNLLALNAAIEAARAGDQGRGFAVVADEVRALAERTAKATREIGGMIKTIQSETRGAVTAMEEGVREVEKGTSEAARSGEALQAILEQINAVTQQANQIATAAEEQTATTGEISSNMQGITTIVQRSAAGASETAGSASQLSHLASELQQIVGQFKVSA